MTPRETILEQDRTLTLEDKGGNGKYYVYVKGDVVYTTDQVAGAITKANEKMGVVVGEDQEYIWKRSRFLNPTFSSWRLIFSARVSTVSLCW